LRLRRGILPSAVGAFGGRRLRRGVCAFGARGRWSPMRRVTRLERTVPGWWSFPDGSTTRPTRRPVVAHPHIPLVCSTL